MMTRRTRTRKDESDRSHFWKKIVSEDDEFFKKLPSVLNPLTKGK